MSRNICLSVVFSGIKPPGIFSGQEYFSGHPFAVDMGVQWPEQFIGQEYSVKRNICLPVVFTGIKPSGIFSDQEYFSDKQYSLARSIKW